MKDRIGQSSSRKKKNTESDFSNVTVVPKPDNYGGFSPDDDGMPPKKKSKLPIILCGLLAVAVVAGGGLFLLNRNGGGDVVQQPAQPSVEYPLNTAELDQDEQALQQVLQSAKSQRVPTMTQLVDLIAINELLGTVESSGDGKNANLVAQLETESLADKAAEFKTTNNDDTIGWIRIPNTNVDYPVVYKAGVENYAYYESKGYDKQYSKDGVIWADYECTFPELSQNTTLYGHNWHNIYTPRTQANMQANDLMFSLVMSYNYTDFAQENPFIYFSTTEQDYVFQVFASYYTDLNFGYNYAQMSQEDFQKVIAEAKAKSLSNYNVPVTSEDKIVTLSTCTRVHGNTNNQRFVVMAKLVPVGTPSTTISTHSNPIAYNSSIDA